jgi:hypothetical protein
MYIYKHNTLGHASYNIRICTPTELCPARFTSLNMKSKKSIDLHYLFYIQKKGILY